MSIELPPLDGVEVDTDVVVAANAIATAQTPAAVKPSADAQPDGVTVDGFAKLQPVRGAIDFVGNFRFAVLPSLEEVQGSVDLDVGLGR